ncbi:MAG: inositol monophosphatase family protein, partial [Rikenellaceae bacterium]
MISRELIDFLIVSGCNAAIIAGKEIMKIYHASEQFDVNINANNTVVTEADRVAHETIKKSLTSTRIPIMSEEGRNILYEERYSWDLYWLVDPLDGTREFIQKNDEFVVCIALMQNNKPLLGVIYIPAEDKLYFSDPDRGAFKIENCNTLPESHGIYDLFKVAKKLDCIKEQDESAVRIVVTRSHINDSTNDLINLIKKN